MPEIEQRYSLNQVPQMDAFPPDTRPVFVTITDTHLCLEPIEYVTHEWRKPGRHLYRHTADGRTRFITRAEHDRLADERFLRSFVHFAVLFNWGGRKWEIRESDCPPLVSNTILDSKHSTLVVRLPEPGDVPTPPWLDVGPRIDETA